MILRKIKKLEKVISIIDEKDVGITLIKSCDKLKEYNNVCLDDEEKLTQEEFDLLKEYLQRKK